METFRCELISWNRVYRLARQLALDIKTSGFRPETIVAIGRGGYVPARILADFLAVMDLTSIKVEHYKGAEKQPETRLKYPLKRDLSGRSVLIVDDVSDTGDSLAVAVDHVGDFGAAAVRTAVLQHKTVSTFIPDYYAYTVKKWRWIIYPWAVIEDVSGFLERMDPAPKDADTAAACLRRQYQLTVPRQMLDDVFNFMS